MALPKLNSITNRNNITNLTPEQQQELQRQEAYALEKDELIRNKTQYTLNILEDEFSKNSDNIERINFIPLEAVLEAPKGFFDKYEPLVLDLTEYVQDKLSNSDYATVVSQVRENPVASTENRKVIITAIGGEFVQYESSPRASRFNRLSDVEKRLVKALVANEIIGLGPLEPLFQDQRVREIAANGPFDVQVEIDGSMRRVPSLRFRDRVHFKDLINRLYTSVNKDVSRHNPLERASLFDKSRVFVTDESTCPDGPNLNIRRHPDDWISPDQMLEWGMASPELFSYLGFCVNNGLSMLIVGATGSGKALSYNTPINTPYGYKIMKDIKKGDIVFNRYGQESQVLETFEQGEKTVYELVLENNIRIECDTEHNWITNDKVYTTLELIDKIKEKDLYIPKAEKIEYKENQLPIHPHGLSLFLTNNIEECFDETLSNINKYEKEHNIKKLDFIPKEYEIASEEDRLWLLKGFCMYSNISDNGEVKIDTINKKIHKSLLKIISSSGFYISEVGENTITYISKNFCKANHIEYPKQYKIKDIIRTDRKKMMKCITVDSEDKSFLCGDENITTHNTTLLSSLTGYFADNKRVVTIEKNIELKGCPTKLFAAPLQAVPAKAGSSTRGVTLADLVEASTQMRPDVIILGECTGEETYDVLNAGNSGHQVFTTIHSDSDQNSINRLETLASQQGLITGKATYDLIVAAIDLIVVVDRFREDGSRRVVSVSEVDTKVRQDPDSGEPFVPVKKIWEFKKDPNSEGMNQVRGDWYKVGELSPERQALHRLDMNYIPDYNTLRPLYIEAIEMELAKKNNV